MDRPTYNNQSVTKFRDELSKYRKQIMDILDVAFNDHKNWEFVRGRVLSALGKNGLEGQINSLQINKVESFKIYSSQKWLTTKGAACYLSTSVPGIRNMVVRKQIPYYKMGGRLLFKREEIDRLIENSRKGGF